MNPKITLHAPERAADVERWFRGELTGEKIREIKQRTIWLARRSPSEGGDGGRAPGLYIKRFPRSLFRDRARHEARMLQSLAAAGIPGPRLVATAQDEGGAYIITEEIANARILDQLLQEPSVPARPLLLKLARLLLSLHDADLDHGDFHAGNVLVRDGELFVIDVHRARAARLSRSRRLEALAFTLSSFSERVPLTELVRFARAYGIASRRDQREVCELVRKRRAAYFRGREKRCLCESTGFGVKGSLFYRKGIDLEPLLEWVRSGAKTAVKETGARGLYRSGRWFLKRTPRARILWKNAHALWLRRVPTPRLDACDRDWVAGEWIDAPNLSEFVKARFASMNRAARDEFLQRLARLVRRMHAYEVFHKDLKGPNVLATNDSFAIVDLDRVRLGTSLSDRERRFNLAQLNASVVPPLTRTDRLRFLRFYCGRDGALWRRRRDWVEKIMRVTIARKHVWPAPR